MFSSNDIVTSKYSYEKINTSNEIDNNLYIPIQTELTKIIDSRRVKDFKDQVFGGYNRSNVNTALDKSLIMDKIEPSLHWCAQLLCSGITNPLWEKLLCFVIKHINIYNPKSCEFLYNRTLMWYNITDNNKFTKDNILLLRNHPTIRLLLCELISLITLSKKRKLNQLPKIKKEEFIIDVFKSRLSANDNKLIENLIIEGDPSEMRVAINEFAHHLFNANTSKSLYWLSWIIEWEKINSKKYGKYECGSRYGDGIDSKYSKDIIWFIWSVINKIKQLKNNDNVNKQVTALFSLYKYKFTPSSKSRKLNYIIMAILYFTELIDWVTPLIDRPEILYQNLLGYDRIFMAIKKQQQTMQNPNDQIRKELMNVVVENNYMVTEKHQQYEKEKEKMLKEKEMKSKELLAKQKKINIESLSKLEVLNKMDKIIHKDVF